MRTALFALLLAIASPAFADMERCAALDTNVEMSTCAWEEYQAADAELNRVWRQVLAQIGDTDPDIMPPDEIKAWRDALTSAQRSWAKFKDDDCQGAVMHEWWGGSGAGLAISTCLYDHTVQRIKDLRTRYYLD